RINEKNNVPFEQMCGGYVRPLRVSDRRNDAVAVVDQILFEGSAAKRKHILLTLPKPLFDVRDELRIGDAFQIDNGDIALIPFTHLLHFHTQIRVAQPSTYQEDVEYKRLNETFA